MDTQILGTDQAGSGSGSLNWGTRLTTSGSDSQF